jgi:hypothetical protein
VSFEIRQVSVRGKRVIYDYIINYIKIYNYNYPSLSSDPHLVPFSVDIMFLVKIEEGFLAPSPDTLGNNIDNNIDGEFRYVYSIADNLAGRTMKISGKAVTGHVTALSG